MPESRSSRLADEEALDLWWVIPNVLAGMPMPFIHAERRTHSGGPLNAYADDFPTLYRVGIRAVVCLLNIRSDAAVYASVGLAFHLLPIADGSVPESDENEAFVRFVGEQRTLGQPVAVHCEAGIGRTGTMIAAYLIANGMPSREAITMVRTARPGAIETPGQLQFLMNLSRRTNHE